MHLLVIDDNAGDVQLIREACAERLRDCHIHTVTDGGSALSYLQSVLQRQGSLPDLILCDINMPRMNGFEFLSVVYHTIVDRSVAVIMFSSTSREETKSLCLHLGASGYLVKPMTYTGYLDLATTLPGLLRQVSVTTRRLDPPDRGTLLPITIA